MAFTIAAVEGWTFTIATSIRAVDGGSRLESFTLLGECAHGNEAFVQDSPQAAVRCGCAATQRVVADRDHLFAGWNAKVGELIVVR